MALHCLPTRSGLAGRPKSASSCFSKGTSNALVPVLRQLAHCSTPAAACAAVQPHRPSAASVSSEAAAADAPAAVIESISSYEDPLMCVPEDFELAPGMLSSVDRTSPAAPEDAYRCIGCIRPECQVRPSSSTAVLLCFQHCNCAYKTCSAWLRKAGCACWQLKCQRSEVRCASSIRGNS